MTGIAECGSQGARGWRRALVMTIALIALLAASWVALSPSLDGGFLFDDIPNLQPLGDHGGVSDRETFERFVWGGIAGPLGRPLSLLTFAANAQDWPADPYPFKVTNLGLHLGLGLLLFLFLRMILRAAGCSTTRSDWVAFFAAAIWLLHPMQSATAFYVVQRMSQLSALFMVLGAIGWLHGRNALIAGRAWSGYFWMSFSVGLGVLVGVFAKETVAVLPFLILAMLITVAPVPASLRTVAWRGWSLCFIGVPLAGMLVLFGWNLTHWSDFGNRSFGPLERMATEWLVLWDYLAQLLVPRAAPSLFNEQWNRYAASAPILWPMVALAAWVLVLAAAWRWRCRYPVAALAVFGFLALHSLEAGPVSLEVHFLHRNYLAIVFPVLAVAYLISRFGKVSAVIGLVAVAALAVPAHQGSRYWGDPHELFAHWARENPASLRAQHESMMRHLMQTEYEVAGERLATAATHYPNSTTVATNGFLLACFTGKPIAPHLALLQRTAGTDTYRHSTDSGLDVLDHAIRQEGCVNPADVPLFDIIRSFRRNPNYDTPQALAELYWVEYRLRARRGQLREALQAVDGKLRHRPSESAWMARAYLLERLGRFDDAADALGRAREMTPYRGLGRVLASDVSRRERLDGLMQSLRARTDAAASTRPDSGRR